MSIHQINNLRDQLTLKLASQYNLSADALKQIELSTNNQGKEGASLFDLLFLHIPIYFKNRRDIIKLLKRHNIDKSHRKEIIKTVKERISISNKIYYLKLMHNLFKYWHVAHLPFAIIMLLIMFVHIIVTVSLGYKWIF